MNQMVVLLTVLIMSHAIAADPSPILVVQERDPWRMVLGSDGAKFAIYDDGSVIYQPSRPTAERPFLRRKIEDPAKAAQKLLGFDPATAVIAYELSDATDQISTTIWTPRNRIEIYGEWRKPFTFGGCGDPTTKGIEERERKMWETLPREVRAFLERIEKERDAEGDPWLPESIEVMLWPYEYAPDDSIAWPAGWPDLKSKTTRKWDDDFFSVLLPAERYPELRKFIASRPEKGAVLINGKKMAISHRFPLPKEAAWK